MEGISHDQNPYDNDEFHDCGMTDAQLSLLIVMTLVYVVRLDELFYFVLHNMTCHFLCLFRS